MESGFWDYIYFIQIYHQWLSTFGYQINTIVNIKVVIKTYEGTRTDRRADRWTGGQTDGWMDEYTDIRMDGWTDIWMDGWTDKWTGKIKGIISSNDVTRVVTEHWSLMTNMDTCIDTWDILSTNSLIGTGDTGISLVW